MATPNLSTPNPAISVTDPKIKTAVRKTPVDTFTVPKRAIPNRKTKQLDPSTATV